MTDTLVEADGDMAGVPVTSRGPWVQMPGGRVFYPLDPRPAEVYFSDIALSLSRLNRYNGLSDEVVSVAQHSVQCVKLATLDGVNDDWLRAILMHDAAEYIVGDLIRPIKCYQPMFKEIEGWVMEAIKSALDIPDCPEEVIKVYDNLAMAWEKRDMFSSSRKWPHMPQLPTGLHRMTSWSAKDAEIAFTCAYEHLISWRDDNGDFWDTFHDTRDWRAV